LIPNNTDTHQIRGMVVFYNFILKEKEGKRKFELSAVPSFEVSEVSL
jgi:hypothetical protein